VLSGIFERDPAQDGDPVVHPLPIEGDVDIAAALEQLRREDAVEDLGLLQAEDVRLLLGHKTMLTAERYYAYLKPSHASSRYQQVLKRARQGASAALITSGDGPAPRGRKPEVRPKGHVQDDGQDQGQQAEPTGHRRGGRSPRKPKARS